MGRVLRLLRSVATVLFGLLLGLGLCELGVRLFSRADPIAENTWSRVVKTEEHMGLLHAVDPVLGWRNRPGADTIFESPEFRVHIRMNELGMRGGALPRTRPAGRRRILLLGDSFVFGWGVEEGETFAAELGRRLPESEPIAMGVAGWGTDQELLWLRDEGLRLQPDVVVLCFYINDLIDNRSPLRWGTPKTTFRLRADQALERVPPPPPPPPAPGGGPALRGERLDDWLVSHLRLYALLRPRVVALAVRRGWVAAEEGLDGYLGYFRRTATGREQAEWDLALAELGEMARLVRAAGARPVVFVVPTKVQVEPGVRARLLASYGLEERDFDFGKVDDILADWGRRERVPVYSPRLEMAREAASRPLYYRYDGHWNRDGHRVAGAALARLLLLQASR